MLGWGSEIGGKQSTDKPEIHSWQDVLICPLQQYDRLGDVRSIMYAFQGGCMSIVEALLNFADHLSHLVTDAIAIADCQRLAIAIF